MADLKAGVLVSEILNPLMVCVMSTTVRFNGFSTGVTSTMAQGRVEEALGWRGNKKVGVRVER